MRYHIKLFLIVLAGWLVISFNLNAQTTIPATAKRLLDKYKLPVDSLSLYIKEINHDEPLIALNIDTPRNPASVIKLVTTLASLEILGPKHLWETSFFQQGALNSNTLTGNLIIQGGGDPFLSRESFWHILHTLQAKGIRHINGDLIIDNSLFEQENGSTADFDKKPYRAYNAFPNAALLNFTAQQFVIFPQNNQVRIYADPPSSNLTIHNKVRLIKGRCRGLKQQLLMDVRGTDKQTIVTFKGKYPGGCGEQQLLRTVFKSEDFIFGVFKAYWETMGGTINGNGKVGLTPKDADLIHVEYSKPLREIILNINKHSNNVMSRQLLLTLGLESGGMPGTKDKGRQAIAKWLTKIGIPAPELIIDNGAGLSRDTRISAHTLARLLEHAYNSPLQPEFLSSLPIAGLDGTMKKRLNGLIDAGNVRIKTGLLNGVRSMAGYVTSRNNKKYIIVSLQNHPGVQNWTGTQIQDEILRWLYNQ